MPNYLVNDVFVFAVHINGGVWYVAEWVASYFVFTANLVLFGSIVYELDGFVHAIILDHGGILNDSLNYVLPVSFNRNLRDEL